MWRIWFLAAIAVAWIFFGIFEMKQYKNDKNKQDIILCTICFVTLAIVLFSIVVYAFEAS